jgi:hypothetical protein
VIRAVKLAHPPQWFGRELVLAFGRDLDIDHTET